MYVRIFIFLFTGYVCFIMLLNCVAFIIIVGCYMKMYCSIRGSSAWNSNDSRVAKRMALLVFTDFFCWAPISFFSLTAAFGLELISLNDAKIFTIFVLPLNSCANPFLYAIFTKQFKKDCGKICRRLEETTINRSLSRFSNRNFTLTWGSSRRPSALNSFFGCNDKRDSRQSFSVGTTQPTDGKRGRRVRLNKTSLSPLQSLFGKKSNQTTVSAGPGAPRGSVVARISQTTLVTWNRDSQNPSDCVCHIHVGNGGTGGIGREPHCTAPLLRPGTEAPEGAASEAGCSGTLANGQISQPLVGSSETRASASCIDSVVRQSRSSDASDVGYVYSSSNEVNIEVHQIKPFAAEVEFIRA